MPLIDWFRLENEALHETSSYNSKPEIPLFSHTLHELILVIVSDLKRD